MCLSMYVVGVLVHTCEHSKSCICLNTVYISMFLYECEHVQVWKEIVHLCHCMYLRMCVHMWSYTCVSMLIHVGVHVAMHTHTGA